MAEEVINVSFNLVNIWNLIEHLPDSFTEEHAKLRAARGAFERTPKVYGNGLGLKFREPSDSERMQDHKDVKSGKIPTTKISKENK